MREKEERDGNLLGTRVAWRECRQTEGEKEKRIPYLYR